MQVEATSTPAFALSDVDTIVLGVLEGEPVARQELQWLLDRGEARAGFRHLAVAHVEDRRVILVGLGSRAELDAERARVAAAVAHARAQELATRSLCWQAPEGAADHAIRGLVEGTLLGAYSFDRYRAEPADTPVDRLVISCPPERAEAVRAAALITTAQNRARDLGNAPPNDLTPRILAAYAGQLDGVSVDVLGEQEIRDAGMGAFAAVAQGSAQEACLIRLEYQGDGAERSPLLALLGKAVTFDSGGLAIKSRDSMHEMKFDMSGGAAVIEAIAALAALGARGRVLGLVGATENLPSGTAMRPGDIVRALDGTTIEIDNPDAEGRLVLADCLCYARAQGAERLVDIATLTGAIVTALGSRYAGLMANDDRWAAVVRAAGDRAGEQVWRMPLDDAYATMINGRYAQLTNRSPRHEAQAITAAELLHHFAGDVPWAHVDIAGTAYDVPRPYLRGKGATGFGVRLLVELALSAS